MAAGAPAWPAGTDDLREIGIDDPLHAGEHARQAAERDQRQPGDDHDPDRRLSRRMAARPAAAGANLCASGRARRCGSTGAACAPRPPPNSSPSSRSTATTRPRARRPRSRRTISIALSCQGARRARPEPSAAGALPVSGQLSPMRRSSGSRRSTFPTTRIFAPNTLGALMQERYDVYKREVVARFYEDHFRWFSRQIVLVDVLRALLAGREAFEDQRLALEAILQSFRYGSGSLFSKLIRGPHIDKVLFAATKADHVPDISARSSGGTAAQHGGVPGDRGEEQQRALRRDPGRLGDLDRRGHAGDRRPARAGRGRPAGRRRASSRNSSSARCRSGRRGRTPGTRRSSTCRCSSRRRSIRRRSTACRTSISTVALEFLVGDRLR